MKYSFDKVIDGITRYIDSEIYPGMNDIQEMIARIAMGRAIENQDNIKKSLVGNGIIRTFGIIDSDGMVDIDGLSKELKREIERKGKLTVSIPMFGKLTFNPTDVDILRQYISGER
jgi:hypothetical protein